MVLSPCTLSVAALTPALPPLSCQDVRGVYGDAFMDTLRNWVQSDYEVGEIDDEVSPSRGKESRMIHDESI